jgi:hypothetical protein
MVPSVFAKQKTVLYHLLGQGTSLRFIVAKQRRLPRLSFLAAEVPLRTTAVSEGGPDQHGTTLAPTFKFEFQTAKQDKHPRSRGAIPELCKRIVPRKTEGAGKTG